MSTTFDGHFDLDGPSGSAGTMAVQAAPFSTYKRSAFPSSPRYPIPQHTQSDLGLPDMRTFSLRGPYGMNISLSTAIGGKFSITFPHRNNRASSEPPPTLNTQTLASTHNSDFINHTITIPVDNETIHDPTFPRAPSPAPTEIEDPDPESILTQLEFLNIKVRDFAYEAPYTSNPSTSAQPAPVPEIFDQYKGIAEFEYRLAQSPRTVPIVGKTMRRLLDLEWVLYEEAEERLHEIDWETLREYDRKVKDGKRYPWRPCTWDRVPNAEERKLLLEERGAWFVNYDRVRRTLDWMEEREERERKQAEQAQEVVRRWEKQEEERRRMTVDGPLLSSSSSSIPTSPSKKRAFDPEDTNDFASTLDDPDTKRPRLSQSQPSSSSLSSSQPYPPPPPKQYPAPLSSYDPILYPDAKNAIELSEQSQPRPVVPMREDTPPAEEKEEEEERPGALVRRPKRLRRTLSRTQTFTQL